MKTAATYLEEPSLEFRYKQRAVDPRDGLSLFGPHSADQASHPRGLSYALVGTQDGVPKFEAFASRLRQAILPDTGLDTRLWATYPGYEAAFASAWPNSPTKTITLDRSELLAAASARDAYKRTFGVVEKYLDAIEKFIGRDEQLHVVICVVPDFVFQNCRPLSKVSNAIGEPLSPQTRRSRKQGQTELFDRFDPRMYEYSVDFRRQIKARSMQHGIPIQIVRESTLRLEAATELGERQLTPLSDRAWNLTTTLFYKAGGKPWRLTTAREGVCYIGVAFRRTEPDETSKTACCAAQMFLDDGDGIVFLGDYGPWYSPKTAECHISRKSAASLIRGIIETYQRQDGKPLKEVFIHCRSSISEDEFEGFCEGVPQGVSVVGIRVRQEPPEGVRGFREGHWPILRSTFWPISDRTGFLWGTGFTPRLRTYAGWETPLPLRIDVQWGNADLLSVARDILGLTKLNYNACRIGEAEPVTVGFSDAVGEILVSNPTVAGRQHKFKFYI